MSAAYQTKGNPTLARDKKPHAVPKQPAPASKPIPAPENWPEGAGPAAYHGVAGEIVRMILHHTEADPLAILAQLLIGFANLIGRRAHFVVEGTPMYLNEYLVVVGTSAKGRKGTSWRRALQILEQVEKAWSKTCLSSGLASGEGLIDAVRDGDGGADKGVEDKRLMVQEEEFASLLKQAQRQGNILSSVIRSAWDKGDLENLTRKRARATGAHISIVGHITADELKSSLSKTEQTNGFANRFLWIVTRRQRLLPDGSRNPEGLAKLIEQMIWAAEFARGVERMERSPEAQELWRKIYEQVSDEHAGIVGVLLGRAEAHLVRLSCTYALLDQSAVVKPEHLKAALAFWQYTERCVRYIFGNKGGTPVGDAIAAALGKSEGGMTRSEIADIFGQHHSSGKIEAALQSLAHQRVIFRESVPTRGRPKEIWRLAALDGADTAPSGLGAELRKLVPEFDDRAVQTLWSEARAKANDATAAEVLHAVSLYMPKVRSGSVRNAGAFLLAVAPSWFDGTALAEHRERQREFDAWNAAQEAGEDAPAALDYKWIRAMIREAEQTLAHSTDAEVIRVTAANLKGWRELLEGVGERGSI